MLDSSCSVVSSYNYSVHVYVGGIIGECYASNGPCEIENTVNMASVVFTGSISRSLYIGGIIGYLSTTSNDITARNCANYGSVTYSGKTTSTSYHTHIGGIVGFSYGSSSNKIFIQNCLNYGTINHKGTATGHLYIGGILGYSYYGTNSIENCVSGGKIIPNKQDKCYIGSVIGYIKTGTTKIKHCYWSSDVGNYSAYGSGSPTITETISFNNETFELSEEVSAGNYTGTSLVPALNAAAEHYVLRGYSHWTLNTAGSTLSFTVNGTKRGFTLDSQLILLPSLANEGKLWFDGWYTDSPCTRPLTNFEIKSNTPLYGKWEENSNSYTITFDTRGGTPVPEPITAQFGNTVNLPSNLTKGNCTLAWWENDYGDIVPTNFTIPAHNITFHAVWLCTRINTAEDFIDFSKIVNSGTNYNGTTVFLDADIDFFSGFSEQFEPLERVSIASKEHLMDRATQSATLQ